MQENSIGHQTPEDFEQAFKLIVTSAQNLDKISRNLCPELDYFVLFSSLCCGRGNIGQENYGMAFSTMEKLCEKRKMENLPALAIQFGPIEAESEAISASVCFTI